MNFSDFFNPRAGRAPGTHDLVYNFSDNRRNVTPSLSDTSLITEAEAYVVRLLSENLTIHHRYHHLNHTLDVRGAALTLAALAQMPSDELEMLELAALFHDTGFVKTYEGHEEESARIAEVFLADRKYPGDRIEKIQKAILETKPNVSPETQLGAYLCDADLHHLSRPEYPEIAWGLRYEWEYFHDRKMSKWEWREENAAFIKGHQFYTEEARSLFDEGKAKNLQELIEKLTKKRSRKKKKKKKGGLQGSRTAQMMFKTASRNHIDLSTLADNKANILLSVNTLLITVVIPLSIRQLTINEFYLLPPLAILVVTSLISMIFATQATRPIRMMGSTSAEQIKNRKSNLFFFGNFYRMNYPDFDEGMDYVINSEPALEDSMKRDLFFLGKSLGSKYNQLRLCYSVFLVGIMLTVVAFFLSYILLVDAEPWPFLQRLPFRE